MDDKENRVVRIEPLKAMAVRPMYFEMWRRVVG